MIFGRFLKVFRMFLCMRLLMNFSDRILKNILLHSAVFRSARKWWTSEFLHTFHAICCFFKVRACAGAAGKAKKKHNEHLKHTSKHRCKNLNFSSFFRSARPNRKNAPKMTSPNPSGTLPGSLREGEIDQLFAPRRSQGRPRQFMGSPGPPRSLSKRAPGRLWEQGRRPRAAQRPPVSHLGATLTEF